MNHKKKMVKRRFLSLGLAALLVTTELELNSMTVLAQTDVSDNNYLMKTVSDNDVGESDSSVSENSPPKLEFVGADISDNDISGNQVSGNDVPSDDVSSDDVPSDNTSGRSH